MKYADKHNSYLIYLYLISINNQIGRNFRHNPEGYGYIEKFYPPYFF